MTDSAILVDPRTALAVFAALVTLLLVLLWPGTGLAARLLRAARRSERVLLEDALKHVHTCQSIGRPCTAESLAGRLEISPGRAASLLSRLAALRLVSIADAGPRLTDAGRESALRLVRTHRLWERYLADRTSVPARDWHDEAERVEHRLTEADADALASRLGHPRWDPHGDPIPGPDGYLPAVGKLTLAGVTAGQTVEVVHLEDEPREIFAALLEDGLGLGTRLQVLERSDRGVRVRSGGREWSIEAMVAGNVTIRVLPEGTRADARPTTLADLAFGETGRVTRISPACRGPQRRRLLDLGVVRGTEITAELASAAGDPVAYRVRGALVALRREQASWIHVERVAPRRAGVA